ncbi:DUF3025 domain-containing protein [Ramlibacter henchirensis]|uniref:DUF3025 domain-containing protein n=1 Tax=Ramlibacter henchirensis TaxID=204072 RepID=A0A4Z0C350_9BURK|nr:DUF3025 domain-containing protein [Ramlibacter henchirensis]TFZ05264.1 DUF3025 domain-containing protein [Ramlibacter henchirensis]
MPDRLDWQAPWYAAWREPGRAVEQLLAGSALLQDALNAGAPAPVRFVPQDALPEGTPYEQFIFERRQCPTRDNLHDFFNGLVWHRMPRAKARLNELQASEIAAHGIGDRRGPVRDAITLFDENGALLEAPQPLWYALIERDWNRLFIELRPQWQHARVLVFGHALLEKLAAPRKDLTAHVWCEPCALDSVEAADAWLAGRCTPERLAGKPFTPLPLSGIPGWDAANQNFSFYEDSVVFRPRRR